MPPRILVRQRSPGRRHQRERRTYRTDLRPTHRPDRLHPGRLSLSPRAVEAIERMIERYATERRDTLGTVGPHARITGAVSSGRSISGKERRSTEHPCWKTARSAPELMSASTSRPAISSPQKEPASTAARFSNAASPANAARWTNTSRPSIRSFSPTATAKTERPFRSSRVPTPFRTTNPRC